MFGGCSWSTTSGGSADGGATPAASRQWPISPQVAALNAAIRLFGRVWPAVPARHKHQITEHYLKCLNSMRASPRLTAVSLNVVGALLSALRAQASAVQRSRDAKMRLENAELQKALVGLLRPFVAADTPLLQCLAVEALSRLAQAVGDAQFVATQAQCLFDALQPQMRDERHARAAINAQRDERSRAGFCIALGVLHR